MAFTNPYNFVQLQPMAKGARKKPVPHGVSRPDLHNGILFCRIFVLSPIFMPYRLPDGKTEKGVYEEIPLPNRQSRDQVVSREPHKRFLQFFNLGEGTPTIPATSLKGNIRSVAEALCNGCLAIFSGYYPQARRTHLSLPKGYGLEPCGDQKRLCPTCRLFGMPTTDAEDSEALFFKGKVTFSDARLSSQIRYLKAVLLAELSSPKPYHSAFYEKNGVVRGRKFYYHRDRFDIVTADPREIAQLEQWMNNPASAPRTSQDGLHRKVTVRPLAPRSTFDFEVFYHDLTGEELGLLIQALELEPNLPIDREGDPTGTRLGPGVYHKLGFGKPVGLGSAAIRIWKQSTLDPLARYGDPAGGDGLTHLEGQSLSDWIGDWKTGFLKEQGTTVVENQIQLPEHVRDLFNILRWPTRISELRYPKRGWGGAEDEFATYQLPEPGREPG